MRRIIVLGLVVGLLAAPAAALAADRTLVVTAAPTEVASASAPAPTPTESAAAPTEVASASAPAPTPTESASPSGSPIYTLIEGSVVDADGAPYVPPSGVTVENGPVGFGTWQVVVPVNATGAFSVEVPWSGIDVTEFSASVFVVVESGTPDPSGCIYSSGMDGSADIRLTPGEPAPKVKIVVQFGWMKICGATGSPTGGGEAPVAHTPPSTSTIAGASQGDASRSPLLVALILGLIGLGAFGFARHRYVPRTR